jgi:23S rRNA (adenine2503-C2)-methyltransferase
VLPQIGALLAVAPIHLAVSLHATTDEVRDVLVPLNKRFPLAQLMATLRNEPQLGRRRPVFFEYTLMDGVNDALEDARRMPRLIAGIDAKVNVIPMNPHADAPYRPPPPSVVDRFTAALHESGLRVTLRRDRGRDIDAACGQLANRAAAPVPGAAAGPGRAGRSAGAGARPESLQEGFAGNRWDPREAGASHPAVEAHALRDR